MSKIETYLPVFSGFYNTIWSPEIDDYTYIKDSILSAFTCSHPNSTIEFDSSDLSDLVWDDNFDDTAYNLDVVTSFIEKLTEYIPFVNDIKYQKLISPRYYNYSNDSVNVEIDIDLDSFIKWMYENKDELDKYLKDRYTSCDGFISHYPNSFDGWEEKTKKFTELSGHYLGSLLDFYCVNLDDDDLELTIYYDVDLMADSYVNEHDILTHILENPEDYDVKLKYTDPNQLELGV